MTAQKELNWFKIIDEYHESGKTQKQFCILQVAVFNHREVSPTNIKIYYNCETVELTVNGQSQGAKNNPELGIFEWGGAKLSEGENQVSAVGKIGGVKCNPDKQVG